MISQENPVPNRYVVYVDETGDHSLELLDKDFPVFALVMVICQCDTYLDRIIPAINRLKMSFFGHEGVILHSRDIRKAQGSFGFLTNTEKRALFIAEVNKIMSHLDYTLIPTVIRKQPHKERYGIWAENPYDLALKFSLERLLAFLKEKNQKEIHVILESRGRREDRELELSFLRIINKGTEYQGHEQFGQIQFHLHFKPKTLNLVGMQIADLAAYPIARQVLNPSKFNEAFNIVKEKIYKKNDKALWGLKIFP